MGGSTLHETIGIPFKSQSFEVLARKLKPNKKTLKRFAGVKLLIIDEFSVISPAFLKFISDSLNSKLDRPGGTFGQLSVIAIIDFSQMLPVASHTLWTPSHKLDTYSLMGQQLFRAEFTKVFVLRNVMRQSSSAFLQLLYNIRTKRVTKKNVELLRTRLWHNNPSEHGLFADAMRIFQTNSQIRKHNIEKVLSLRKPTILLRQVQEPPEPNLTDKDFIFPVCLDVKILLQRNLHLGMGLSTNTIGVLKGIIFDPSGINSILPRILLVEFEGTGFDELHGLVPVVPITESISHPSCHTSFKMTQFPISLGYSISTHKSQGLEFPRAVISLSNFEMFPSQAYVQCSRVPGIECLLLDDESVSEDRFKSSKFFDKFPELVQEYKRLGIYESML